MPRKTLRRRSNKHKTHRRSRRNHGQKGGLIEDYSRLFDATFGNEWILTGSEAVRILAEHFGIPHTLRPSDLDVVYVSPTEFRSRFVGDLERVQNAPGRSMTFAREGRSFDLLVEQRTPQRFLVIPYMGTMVRILSPARILREYASELDLRGNKRNADLQKIAILQEVLRRPMPEEMRMSPVPERVREPTARMGRLMFDGGFRQRGGLGRIPTMATVDIQADPYSARMLVSAEDADKILAARE